MSDHEALEIDVAAWVLGALDQDEAESMRSHVEGCAACRETAARLRRVVAALPLAVDEVAPPARLRERVLAAAAGSTPSSPAPSRVQRKIAQPSGRGRFTALLAERVPVYAAAAMVVSVLVAGLVVGALAGRSSQSTPPSQVARFNLTGHQALGGARATVIDLKSDGLALVDFSGLPELGPNRVYEVWLITPGGRADRAAVFVPDSNGSKVVLVNHALEGYSQMAITDEAGPDGSQAPTQQPLLYGTVA